MNAVQGADYDSVREAVRQTIYRACLLLDDGRFSDWLALCAPDFCYKITAYSPEIRKDMTWYEQDIAGLQNMIEMLPRHNTDHGRLMRHATVYTIDIDRAEGLAVATTAFSCYRTSLDGINSHLDAGESRLFAIGKYYDKLRLDHDGPRFVERRVVLETRRLDKGSHYPV